MVGRVTASVTFIALSCAVARAEAPAVGGRSPRAIGRAGVATVSDDGGGALLVNPAGLARRDSARLQLALAFVDDEMYWLHSSSSPAARDQSSSRLLPLFGFEAGLGDWIVGVAAMTSARSERVFRRPGRIPPGEFGNTFEYRYAGLAGSIRRDTLTFGAARRFSESVAFGFSLASSRVGVTESRRIWAGHDQRVLLGLPHPEMPGDPTQDAELTMTADDNIVPSTVIGLLVAPEDSHFEFAASLGWSAPARVSGTVAGETTSSPSIRVNADSPNARLEVEQPITVRTGARYVGERFVGEVGVDLWVLPRRAHEPVWRFDDLRITDTTVVGSPRNANIEELPSRLSSHTHGALRGALDAELVAGFLWATAGYAYTSAGTTTARLSPTFGDLGGHTLAVGLEATAGGFTVTLGWARTWSIKTSEPRSQWQLDNPFGTGDSMVPSGTYDGSTDMIGLSIDTELWAPED